MDFEKFEAAIAAAQSALDELRAMMPAAESEEKPELEEEAPAPAGDEKAMSRELLMREMEKA
jgi:hypothetical protein